MQTPTIQVTIPLTPWQRLWRGTLMVGGLVVLCGVSFRMGQHYPLDQAAAPGAPQAAPASVPAPAQAAPAAANALPAAPTTPTSASAAPGEAAAAAPADAGEDGLSLKSFSISLDPEAPDRLRYRLILANTGRKFVGSLKFVITGERNGKPEQLHYPPAGAPLDPTQASKLRVEVSRFLKTEGTLPLPEGFAPKAATVDLLEPTGVRLSKQTRMGRSS